MDKLIWFWFLLLLMLGTMVTACHDGRSPRVSTSRGKGTNNG